MIRFSTDTDPRRGAGGPVDAHAAAGVTIEWNVAPAGAGRHVHIKFTAPYREPHVTSYGEMMWEINRGYEGQWYLFWEP